MENLENIQKKLDGLASALLLFQEDTLVLVNAYGKSLLPGLTLGASADEVLGDAAAEFHRFSGTGSMLFSVDFSGLSLDAKATKYDAYTALELIAPANALSASALRSISEGLLDPMTTVMALTPKLLPQLAESGDPANLERTAQLNKSIYTLYRAANHLRLAGMYEDIPILNKKRVHLMYWLQDYTDRLRSVCALADRQLQVELPVLDEMCDLDQEQMERAISNLISNAIKYTKTDGLIRISAAKTGPHRLRLTIRDNGCGIPPHEMGVIFQRKEHRPGSPDPRCGIGLGLPIARSIVQAHGGNLFLESTEGAGTAVHLLLPTTRWNDLPLHATVQTPSFSAGFDAMLVELADALPSSAFDTRALDL